jgi:outer membrane lipoprotein-sorting protein
MLWCVHAALALSLVAAPGGRCASTAACLQAIEAAQRDTRTLTADFVQVKHVSLLDEPLVSTGRFTFKRPDKILLKIEKPQPATVLINGSKVEIPGVPASERQAVAMAPIATMLAQLGAIFSGSTQSLQEGFETTARPADQDASTILVTLVPRRPAWKQLFHKIDLSFGGPQLMVQQIGLEDSFGDHLEITMHNVQRNIELPDSMFSISEG